MYIKDKIGTKFFCVMCCLISIVWWVFSAITGLSSERIWGSFFLQYLWEYSIGMILADYLSEKESVELSVHYIIALMIVGIGAEGFLGYKGGWGRTFNDIPALLGFVSLGLLFCQSKGLRKIGKRIANISYEWYLLHILVFTIVFSISDNLLFSVLALLTSLCSAIIYKNVLRIITRKMMAKKKMVQV